MVIPKRMTAEMEGSFCVFLIGMRINRAWKIHKWWPVFSSMGRMLRELRAQPDLGFLGGHSGLAERFCFCSTGDLLDRSCDMQSTPISPMCLRGVVFVSMSGTVAM